MTGIPKDIVLLVVCGKVDKEIFSKTWCDGLSDQSFMVDPLSYFSFQPVFHDWYNKSHGMCYPVVLYEMSNTI